MPLRPELEAFNAIKHELRCPRCEGMLEPKLNEQDEFVIYCLACPWTVEPGLAAIDRISDLAHTLTTET